MDDDDEIVVVTYERPSFPWEPSQMQADVLNLAADSNFMIDQSEFAAEAAKQIETLTDEKTE